MTIYLYGNKYFYDLSLIEPTLTVHNYFIKKANE